MRWRVGTHHSKPHQRSKTDNNLLLLLRNIKLQCRPLISTITNIFFFSNFHFPSLVYKALDDDLCPAFLSFLSHAMFVGSRTNIITAHRSSNAASYYLHRSAASHRHAGTYYLSHSTGRTTAGNVFFTLNAADTDDTYR